MIFLSSPFQKFATKESGLSPETISAQALRQTDTLTGGITPAIHPSSTFLGDQNYQLVNAQHSYGRDQNPGYAVAENVLAEFEGAPSALLFGSGMAAAMAVVQSLRPGDQIVAPKVMYRGLRNWLIKFCDNWGLGLARESAVPSPGIGYGYLLASSPLMI